jgi:hypothetical protein
MSVHSGLRNQDIEDVTLLLNRSAEGDAAASQAAWFYFQHDVRTLAEQLVRRETRIPDLQPTVVIQAVWIRLFARAMESETESDELDAGQDEPLPIWEHRGHFWSAIVHTVKCFLIDEYRRASAAKRGGGRQRIPLEVAVGELSDLHTLPDLDIPALHAALERLRRAHPLTALVVEHRYLLGMTIKQTAACLEIASRTVDHHWQFGRSWLRSELDADGDAPA